MRLALVQPSGRLVAASKAAVPTVSDPASALQLGNFAKSTAAAVAELRNAANKVRHSHTCIRTHKHTACVCMCGISDVIQHMYMHTYAYIHISTCSDICMAIPACL